MLEKHLHVDFEENEDEDDADVDDPVNESINGRSRHNSTERGGFHHDNGCGGRHQQNESPAGPIPLEAEIDYAPCVSFMIDSIFHIYKKTFSL